MTRCRSQVDSAAFDDALHLHFTVQAVARYNVTKFRNTGEPIATIKAIHTGPNASKASLEDASGLEPVIRLARGARVMLTSYLWTDAGLVNTPASLHKFRQHVMHYSTTLLTLQSVHSLPSLHTSTTR